MVDPRRISVHQSLGGGSVADVLMWRRKPAAVFLLVSTSALWFLFERGGYNLLAFIANVLLLLVTILFLWAKSASLLNSDKHNNTSLYHQFQTSKCPRMLFSSLLGKFECGSITGYQLLLILRLEEM